FEERVNQLERLTRQEVTPTDQNRILVRDQLREKQNVFTNLLRDLNLTERDTSDFFGRPPATRTEAFFDIAAFIEEQRTFLEEQQIVFPENYRFTFGAYVNEGPDPSLIPRIHRQKKLVGYLVEQLAAVRPQQIHFIQREPPPGQAGPGPQAPTGRGAQRGAAQAGAGDFFTLPAAASVRVPDLVDSLAFRVAFTGNSETLRSFLNQIAESRLPFVVRGIEVEAQGVGGPGTGAAAQAQQPAVTEENVRIVARHLSRFTLTLEFVTFAGQLPQVGT
ncbi:MAG: hypothetical protein EA425_14025, partial [Puniceicoccaceae bacterium]